MTDSQQELPKRSAKFAVSAKTLAGPSPAHRNYEDKLGTVSLRRLRQWMGPTQAFGNDRVVASASGER